MEKPKRIKPITRNDRAAEALRESEHKFRVLAETMPAAIFLYQGDKYIYVNPAAEKITGYSKEELIGMNFWDWVSPEYKDIMRDRGRARQMGESAPSRYEVKFRAKDGREGWADFAAGLIEYGGRPAVIAVAFDITNRKKAEKALKKSQYILSKAQEIAHVGNWAWNLRTGGMKWSDEGFRIFGYSPQEFEPSLDWLLSRVHPDDKDTVTKSTDATRYRQKLGSIDYRIIMPDGSIRYINTVADKLVKDAEGKPLWVYGINQDVTARKQAEKALVKSRAILSRAQDIAHIGNWAWDLKTNNMQWSDEIFKIFGYRPQEFQPTYGWAITRVFPDDRGLLASSARAAINENKLFNIDFRIITPDGSIHYLNIVADRIKKDRSGAPEWMYGIVEDITKRKFIENKFRDAQAQAELYVDLMGHDINNMNMVALGFLEMADDKLRAGGTLDMSDEQLILKAVENIKSSSILIDNVRKLQRERAGELKLMAIDIVEVLASVKDQYLNVPGRDVKIDLDMKCSCAVIANDLLRDVFSNLVGNSIKHSSGPLTVNIRMTCDGEAGMKFCKVAVEDNGPGIPDTQKALIFDRSQTVKKLRGKGLGLYIVNTLVSDFHGKVWVEDRVYGDHTKGARFVVMLPAIEK
ncbi:putative histidine kinase [Methanocella paludicola SANAE]|uniref:histidine kinase n=2 Tax=Methanocella TaxID=570266 RepID=D1Z0P7_METPS|nr:putative histidine kinase [Methanocella paludicola SANAE]